MKNKGFTTRTVHAGQKPDGETGAVIPPIYQTSTYAQEAPAKHKGYEYTRAGNPNFSNLETALAAAERGRFATVFSSGLGAATAVMNLLQAGDHVVAVDDLYGGSYRLFTQWGEKFGLTFTFVPGGNAAPFEEALRKETKLIWMESPTNPLLKVTDIKAVAAMAKKKGVLSLVDNTFASPYFQNPLTMGVDLVLHSTTKYIGGHSDVVGGVVVINDKVLKEKLDFGRMVLGVNPSPFDCWLTQRGLKTLGLRMERHQQNAKGIVGFLKNHRLASKIYYPGFGGMVSAEFKLGDAQTGKFISSLELFVLAESLGGVESLVCHPASMTHASIPKEVRESRGLGDGLVRFSVGIEDLDDLTADLEKGLAAF